MKASYIHVGGKVYLVTSNQGHLTLYDTQTEPKQLSDQALSSDFLIITMTTQGLFATIGYDKKFRIWSIEGEELMLKYCCSFPKKLTHGAVLVIESKELCYIADKFGDVYMIDVSMAMASHDIEAKIIRQDFIGPSNKEDVICKFIMGHQEVITIVDINKDFIVTVDKANKIKVSKVPRYYEIHGIYFGHKEDIILAKLFDDSTLLTIDKGRNAIVWDLTKTEDAILFTGKVGIGDIDAIGMFDDIHIGIVNEIIEIHLINKVEKKFVKEKQIPMSKSYKCLELLADKQFVLIGASKEVLEANKVVNLIQIFPLT